MCLRLKIHHSKASSVSPWTSPREKSKVVPLHLPSVPLHLPSVARMCHALTEDQWCGLSSTFDAKAVFKLTVIKSRGWTQPIAHDQIICLLIIIYFHFSFLVGEVEIFSFFCPLSCKEDTSNQWHQSSDEPFHEAHHQVRFLCSWYNTATTSITTQQSTVWKHNSVSFT